MDIDRNTLLFYIGSLCFLVLLILSQVFYLERTAFWDISFHLFHILKDGEVQPQNYRYGSVFTQLFPLAGYYLDLSLENVARVYSAGFVLYQYLIFLLCSRWIKDYRYALAIVFLNVFMTTHTFYWIQSEFLQGLPLIILCFAVLDKYRNLVFSTKHILPTSGIVLFLVWLNFYHPLGIFPFVFLVIYFIISGATHKKELILSAALYLLFFLVKSIYFSSGYDSNALSGLSELSKNLGEVFTIQSSLDFYGFLIRDYYFLLIGILVLGYMYIRKREFTKLAFLLLSFIGYSGLINLNYYWGTNQFYLENQYMTLCVIIGVPLIFDFLDKLSIKQMGTVLLLVIALRLIHISSASEIYSDRVEWFRDYIQRTEHYVHKKMIVNDNILPMDILFLSWATPYEFWLLSTLDTGESRSILMNPDPEKYREKAQLKRTFVTSFREYEYDEFPEKYFNFTDSSAYFFVMEIKDYGPAERGK